MVLRGNKNNQNQIWCVNMQAYTVPGMILGLSSVLITTVCVCTTMTGNIITVVLWFQYQTVIIFPVRVLPYTTTGQHSNQDRIWCVNIGERVFLIHHGF